MSTIVHDAQYVAGGHLKITVADTPVPLTAALITKTLGSGANASSHKATKALVQVETYPIYYTLDGTAPATDGSTGHYAEVGDIIEIKGHANIKNFQACRVGSNTAYIKATSFFNDCGGWS